MKKLRLQLSVTVDYDLDGATPSELRDRLRQIWDEAYGNGVVTDDLGAVIKSFAVKITGSDDRVEITSSSHGPVSYADPQDPATIMAWLHNIPGNSQVCIDDDGLRLQVVGNEEIYLEVGGHEPEKVPLSISDFVDRLGQLGADAIIPEVAYRTLCQEMDGDPVDEDRKCRLELSDRPAFRQGMNDYIDGMQKDRQWVTFDNGNYYYTADDVKTAIGEFDGDDVVYELEPELKRIIDFWL